MPNEGGGGYGGLGSGGNYQKLPKRGSGRSLPPQRYTPPPQPISRPTREQAPSRPAPRPKPKPISRPAASRENRPNAVAATPANRIALLQRVLAAYSPPPSPDRTTGREQAGFSSEAFTGKAPRFVDEANGFFPDAQGALHPRVGQGYGMQAGNPRQQALAKGIADRENRYQSQTSPTGAFGALGRAAEKALANYVANSPVGAGVGNVIGTQTWDKLAPLFARGAKDMPQTSFSKTGKFAGYAEGGKVKVSPSQLQGLFSPKAETRSTTAKSLRGLFAHEFSHTQQKGGGTQLPFKDRSMGTYNPRLEGGADAFEGAVAPLLGYRAQSPDPGGEYGRAQIKFGKNLRKILINQFPRVNARMTPAKQQRANLAQ